MLIGARFWVGVMNLVCNQLLLERKLLVVKYAESITKIFVMEFWGENLFVLATNC